MVEMPSISSLLDEKEMGMQWFGLWNIAGCRADG
jgi:hypothetical protein